MYEDKVKLYAIRFLMDQYREKPRAAAIIQSIIDATLMGGAIDDLIIQLNLNTAVGVWLDDIHGARVFVTRGELNDAQFRELILLKIIFNKSPRSLALTIDMIKNVFGDRVTVSSGQKNDITYLVASETLTPVIKRAIALNILPKLPATSYRGTIIFTYSGRYASVFTSSENNIGVQPSQNTRRGGISTKNNDGSIKFGGALLTTKNIL